LPSDYTDVKFRGYAVSSITDGSLLREQSPQHRRRCTLLQFSFISRVKTTLTDTIILPISMSRTDLLARSQSRWKDPGTLRSGGLTYAQGPHVTYEECFV